MPELPTPTAPRLARPRWLDLRLCLGLLLVLGSVLVGARIFARGDDSVAVWALRHDVGPNFALAAGDVEVRQVRIPGGASHYVHAARPAAGLITTRRFSAGELLAAGAVVRGSLRDYREVPLAVDAVEARGLDEHAVVDVYVIPKVRSQAPDPAASSGPGDTVQQAPLVPVMRSATVVAREDQGRGLGASSTVAVTLLVPYAQVGRLVAAAATGDVKLVRVPSSGSDG